MPVTVRVARPPSRLARTFRSSTTNAAPQRRSSLRVARAVSLARRKRLPGESHAFRQPGRGFARPRAAARGCRRNGGRSERDDDRARAGGDRALRRRSAWRLSSRRDRRTAPRGRGRRRATAAGHRRRLRHVDRRAQRLVRRDGAVYEARGAVARRRSAARGEKGPSPDRRLPSVSTAAPRSDAWKMRSCAMPSEPTAIVSAFA